jgi:hypothetical protein
MSYSDGLWSRRRARSLAKKCAAFTALSALAFGCGDPDVFLPFAQFGGPAGVIDGTVTYSGALPCTENQRVVGAAILLVFDVRLLPPPQGLGTSAASLAVVPGETLFSGVRDRLTFNPDGSRWCGPPVDPNNPDTVVTVSTDWAVSPLAPATYQVRGFYDVDGSFDPGFSITNLPTKGDVGGGAIENAAEVLQGGHPRYRAITLKPPGETGSRVSGVAVTLGLTLPIDRPVFYPQGVSDQFGKNMDPMNVVMPSDFQLETFSLLDPAAAEQSFLALTFGPGVPPEEVEIAAAKPFNMPVPGGYFFFSRQDVNNDGKIDSIDHTPESGVVPAFFPLSIFSKLAEGSDLAAQSTPAVIIQGLTIWKSLKDMGDAMLADKTFQPMGVDAIAPTVKVGIRPAALCLHVANPTIPGLLVVTHETDKAPEMHKIITDEAAVTGALAAQFGRPVEIAYGCLPEGRYAMNLVYETGQAWTVPNESHVCSPLEPPSADGKMCGTRASLPSQGAVLTVGPPNDPTYCASAPGAAKIAEACKAISGSAAH